MMKLKKLFALALAGVMTLALLTGSSWQINSKIPIYTLHKAGTVRPICKADSTIYIWISYKLQSIICNLPA